MTVHDLVDNLLNGAEIGDHSSIQQALIKKDPDELLQFCSEISKVLPSQKPSRSAFSFIADSSQSGLPHPCASFACRSKQVANLLAFASTYADQISAVDPFSYIVSRYHASSSPRIVQLEVAQAIAFVITATPLWNRNILTFYPFYSSAICSDCYSKALRAYAKDRATPTLHFEIMSSLAADSTVLYERRSSVDHVYIIKGLESIDCCEWYYHDNKKRGGARYSPGILDPSVAVKTGLFYTQAKFIENDLVQKFSASEISRSGHIFSNDVEINVMRKLFGSQFSDTRFSMELPFLNSRNIHQILAVRDAEWHHFDAFRDAFKHTSKEIGSLTPKAASSMLDGLALEVGKLENKFRSFRRSAKRDVVDGLGTSFMALGASVMSAGLSTYLAAVAAVLGGGHFARSMVPALRKRMDEPEDIRESRLYFAWKVRSRLG